VKNAAAQNQTDRIRWWDRWNRALFPYIGPPPLGPYNEEPLPPTGPKPCPLCGAAMDLHVIERTADDHTPTRLHCPVPPARG
jgi:hypothetical protein